MGTTCAGYDPANRPVSTKAPDQANRLTGYGSAATYRYNGDGLRTTKTISGITTGFTWDVAQGLPLLLVDGTTSYIYGPGGVPLEQITSAGQVTYYHQDQLGSTRALTNSSGTVVATYTYDPYGQPSGSTGTATNPFRYAGQYTDPETGYQYLRARYYDPATATFLTRDPLEPITGTPYAYVNNSPLNYTDPSGEIPVLAAVAIGWAVVEAGAAVADAFSTADTLTDPCASGWDKAISIGGLGASIGLPGGGYSTGASQILKRSSKQLQKKFKHAADFGVTGNYSKANAARFSEAIHQHMNAPSVQVIAGTYRNQPVTHYLDSTTGLNVIAAPDGTFISGWKLSPGQLANVRNHGGL